jgi:hypothetical protein
MLRRSEGSQRKIGDQRAAPGQKLVGESRVFLGIDDVDLCAKRRDRPAFCRDRDPMTGGVDGACDATNAMPRIMTNAGAARAHARRSAMPEPYGVGWRVPTMATPGLVNTSGFPRTRRMSGGSSICGSSISFRRGGYDPSSNREPGDVGRRGLLQSVALPVPRTCPGPTTGQRRFRCQRSPVQSETSSQDRFCGPKMFDQFARFCRAQAGVSEMASHSGR